MGVRILAGHVLLAGPAVACSVTGIAKPADLVKDADAIVCAKAVEYSDGRRDTDPAAAVREAGPSRC